jgi:hypothetical protein
MRASDGPRRHGLIANVEALSLSVTVFSTHPLFGAVDHQLYLAKDYQINCATFRNLPLIPTKQGGWRIAAARSVNIRNQFFVLMHMFSTFELRPVEWQGETVREIRRGVTKLCFIRGIAWSTCRRHRSVRDA